MSQGRDEADAKGIRAFTELAPEMLRTLSPERFHACLTQALDQEQSKHGVGATLAPIERERHSSGLAQYYMLSYHESGSSFGSPVDLFSNFLIAHHVPSLVSTCSFEEVVALDMRYFSTGEFGNIVRKYVSKTNYPANQNASNYYFTSRPFLPKYRKDGASILARYSEIVMAALGREDILPINVFSLAEHADAEVRRIILRAATQLDGFAVSVSPTSVEILPYVTCDALSTTVPAPSTFRFNVSVAALVSPVVQALYGLQDLIEVSPQESKIEAYLIEHPEILLRDDYVDIKPQVTISPSGDRPEWHFHKLHAKDR